MYVKPQRSQRQPERLRGIPKRHRLLCGWKNHSTAPALNPFELHCPEESGVEGRCILHSAKSAATTVVNTTKNAAGTVAKAATSIGGVAISAAKTMAQYASDAEAGVIAGADAAAKAGAEFAKVVGKFACFPCDATAKKNTYKFVNFQTAKLSKTLLSQQSEHDICQ